jgi:hypothetical protein
MIWKGAKKESQKIGSLFNRGRKISVGQEQAKRRGGSGVSFRRDSMQAGDSVKRVESS